MDQSGESVAGAKVQIGWESAAGLLGKPDPGQISWVTTGADGSWNFLVGKPHRAFVTEVRKEGYVYDRHQNPPKDLVENRTTPGSPFVNRLRKLGETTFLLKKEGELLRVPPDGQKTVLLDVVKDRGEERRSGPTYTDVSVSVAYRQDDSGWTVTYRSAVDSDGIIASENLLHEAPAEGYKSEVTLKTPPWPRYLYLRTRTPAIYSRLALEHKTWKEYRAGNVFRILCIVWVNPYGSRNLEFEPQLNEQWRLRKKLEQEAQAALLRDERPANPDLSVLIKEAKEKAGNDE